MMLLIQDRDPYKAASLVPDKLKFKQLLELGQLVCSANISKVYKKIPQGKELQAWIKRNKVWTDRYMTYLWYWVSARLNCKPSTLLNLYNIRQDLIESTEHRKRIRYPKTAIFRYVKEYSEFTQYKTNSELPFDIAVEEYKKYVEWKVSKQLKN